MKFLKREVIFYFAVLLVMALVMHRESLPQKIGAIISSENQFHPFLWAMVGYIFLWIPRAIFIGTKKIISKGKISDTSSY